MQTTSEIIYPLPRPSDYTEPESSRGFFITLRPPPDKSFTNREEEEKKLIDYAKKLAGYQYTIIAKELNNKTSDQEGYHYHILIVTKSPCKISRKKNIQKDLVKLFPDNLNQDVSTNVRFIDSKFASAVAYTCKDGDYSFTEGTTQTDIEDNINIYLASIGKHPNGKKKYRVYKQIGHIFEVLLEFCKDEDIRHCNYNPPEVDELDRTECDKVDLFVIKNRMFKQLEYVVKYFISVTGNLDGADSDRKEKLIKHGLFHREEFEQAVITNKYIGFDNGNIIVDGPNAKILSPEEATQVLSTYTPLRTYKENPRDNPQYPNLFYDFIERSKVGDMIMEILRYYIAGENNESLIAYQLVGGPNTGKTTIIDIIVNHYGTHAKEFCHDGKYSFSDVPLTLLRYAHEINLYHLHEEDGMDKILLPVLERRLTVAPYKRRGQVDLHPAHLITATNPERLNKKGKIITSKDYDNVGFSALNSRVTRRNFTNKICDRKTNNSEKLKAETCQIAYDIATKTHCQRPEPETIEDQR